MKVYTKIFTSLILIFLMSATVSAQADKSKRPSPPAQATATIAGVNVTIDYSQPSLKSRPLNTLAPVGKVWRTGANEASWIEISDNLKINDKELKKGKYGFFTINNETEWIIIFNETWDQWGSYNYDQSKDALRVSVKPSSNETSVEKFTIDISDDGKTSLKWGKSVIAFMISK